MPFNKFLGEEEENAAMAQISAQEAPKALKIDVSAALTLIRTIYRDAEDISIVQTFVPMEGWKDIAPLPFARVNELNENVSAVQLRLKKPGDIAHKYPDFQIREFQEAALQASRPKLQRGDAVIYDRRPVGEPSLEGEVSEVRASNMAPERHWVVDVRLSRGEVLACPAERVYALKAWRPNAGLTLSVNQGRRDASVVARDGMEVLVEYEMPAGTTALGIMDIACTGGGYKGISYAALTRRWIAALQGENGVKIEGLSWTPQKCNGVDWNARKRAMEIAAKLGKFEWNS